MHFKRCPASQQKLYFSLLSIYITKNYFYRHNFYTQVSIIQLCSGITRGSVLNAELNAQKLQKLIVVQNVTSELK